ncbi:unnamed protein product, partial [Pocillopora meandrina]
TALDRIGLTNHYDYPEKICINEQFYSWYFFDCITKTFILSDHGHTMTRFSYTEEERRELFDPLFFMTIPDGVKDKLGTRRTSALITYQKRLFMLYDVQKAFMSLNDPRKMNSNDYSVTGIFSEIAVNSTRADFYMLPLTRCKCEGFDAEIPETVTLTKHGYGNCKRLVGKSFEKIVKRFQGEYILTRVNTIFVSPTKAFRYHFD